MSLWTAGGRGCIMPLAFFIALMKQKLINFIVLKKAWRIGAIALACIFFVWFGLTPGIAQLKNQKRITSMRVGEAAEGSRVTVVSDLALNDYEAYRRGNRFYVKLPGAGFASARPNLRGKGFEDVQVQKVGDSVLISFLLQPGTAARVEQRFNRLEVVFSTPGRSQNATASSGNPLQSRPQDIAGPSPPDSSQSAPYLIQSRTPAATPRPEQASRTAANNATVGQGNPGAPSIIPTGQSTPTRATATNSPKSLPSPSLQSQPSPASEQPAATPSLAANSQNLAPRSGSFSQGLSGNWYIALIAALLLLSLSFLFATNRGSKFKRIIKRWQPEGAGVKPKSRSVVELNEPVATVVTSRKEDTSRDADRAPASTTNAGLSEELPPRLPIFSETSRIQELVQKPPEAKSVSLSFEANPSIAEQPLSIVPVQSERTDVEVKKLLARKEYDAAVIDATDSPTRQVISAALLTALGSHSFEQHEPARRAYLEHGYFDDATRDLRTADSPAERAAAARKLGLVGAAQGIAHLSAALFDSAPEVRRAAVESLGQIGDSSASFALNGLLLRETSRQLPHAVIRHAIRLITTVGPGLAPVAGSSSVNVRARAENHAVPNVQESEVFQEFLESRNLQAKPADAEKLNSLPLVAPPAVAGTREVFQEFLESRNLQAKLTDTEKLNSLPLVAPPATARTPVEDDLVADETRLRFEEQALRNAAEELERRRSEAQAAREKAEERARQKAEQEARVRAKVEARLRAEEEARRKAEQEAARRKAEEEAHLREKQEERARAEKEARRLAEEETRFALEAESLRRAAEDLARRRVEAETARKLAEEEAHRRAEEEIRRRIAEEARLRAEEEARLRAEEEARQLQEEARLRAEAEVRRLAEEDALRRAEEERLLREAEERRLFEQEQLRQEQQALLLAAAELTQRRAELEETRRRAEEEARLLLEAQERIRVEEEERRRFEEERQQLELEAQRRVEQERQQREAEAQRRIEEEQRKTQEQARLLAEEEERRLVELDAVRKMATETARQRAEQEQRIRTEIEVLRQAEEEQHKRIEAETRRRALAEARLKEEEARRLAQEEALLKAEKEARRLAEEIHLRVEEETRRRAEAEACLKEEEARLQVEAEARLEAEEETGRLAEEARLRTEEESRRRAEAEARLIGEEARHQAEEGARLRVGEKARRLAAEARWSEEGDARWRAEEESQQKLVREPAQVEATDITPEQSVSHVDKGIDIVHAEKGIEQLDDDSGVPAEVLKKLRSDDALERTVALAELSRIGGDDAFRFITRAFDDQALDVRNAAARALHESQSDRAASFTRALREGSPERRRNIGAALAASGLANDAISNLTGESRERTYDAFSLLFLMAKAGEVHPLMQAIEDHANIEVRLAVVKLLALSGQPEILPAFRRLAVRRSLPSEVRSAVMEAIYQISSQTRETAPSAA